MAGAPLVFVVYRHWRGPAPAAQPAPAAVRDAGRHPGTDPDITGAM
jgi:hypothetical protein